MDECRSGWAARREEGGRRRAESGGISPHFCCFWPHLHTQLRGWNRNGPEWSGMVRNGAEWSGKCDGIGLGEARRRVDGNDGV